MDNQYILTPFFLDQRVIGYEPLLDFDWQLIEVPLSEGPAQARMSALYRPLADAVSEAASSGDRPVSVAGDCCTTIGVLAGLHKAGLDPALIWFDAHGDFNTWETTPSGFLGGMPLAMLVGRGEQTIVGGGGMTPLHESQVILTDARDLDPGEREALEESNVTHLNDVQVLLDYPLPDKPIYVHFDTDVIDPRQAPAMNYASPGGPSVESLRRVFRYLAQTGRVAAVSLSAWNPKLDTDGRSREVCMGLLDALVGAP